MSTSSLEQIERDYLQQLYNQTNGDASAQVSMYEVGEALNLDRDTSSQIAQDLIGLNLVEIKTLSGGIGISSEGIMTVEGAGDNTGGAVGGPARMSNEPVLTQNDLEAVQQVCEYLKKEAGAMGLDFDGLTELMADLRTIDAQLTSSRPKTAIARGCFESIRALLAGLGRKEALERLDTLIGD